MEEVGDDDLLIGLIYGVLHETDPVGGADFATKLAICARMTGGDQELYSKAVKKALVEEARLTDMFPPTATKEVIRSFLRAIRKARNDSEKMEWLGQQFENKQDEDVVRDYLIAVERTLSKALTETE